MDERDKEIRDAADRWQISSSDLHTFVSMIVDMDIGDIGNLRAEPPSKEQLRNLPTQHAVAPQSADPLRATRPPSTSRDFASYIEGDENVPTDAVGRLGRYHDRGLLGAGGMGEVRRVFDPTLKRTLVMKLLHPQLLQSSTLCERFIEEARVQAQLEHPNIVPVHEIGQLPDGRLYFTMLEVRGQSLHDRISEAHSLARSPRHSPTEADRLLREMLRVLHSVCEAVAYAHDRGVLHRDLKPENIMVGGFGTVLVVDWGLAKVVSTSPSTEQFSPHDPPPMQVRDSRLTQAGAVSGTPAYMSPEQAQGDAENVGPLSDVYALGAILYEILAGRPPYEGATASEVLEQARHHAPMALTEISSAPQPTDSKIPRPARLIAICEQAMRRDQAARTKSAASLATALEGWLHGAEQRDKALQALTTSAELRAELHRREQRNHEVWTTTPKPANQTTQEAWQHWQNARAAHREVEDARIQLEGELERALMHDPTAVEAHLELAQLRQAQQRRALREGSIEHARLLSTLSLRHLSMLPEATRAELNRGHNRARMDLRLGEASMRGAFVGRWAALAELRRQLTSDTPLLELSGEPGVGKTRLALQLAEDLQRTGFRVVYCPIEPMRKNAELYSQLAKALEISATRASRSTIESALSAAPTVLMLDRAEVLSADMTELLHETTTACPELKILLVSRRRGLTQSSAQTTLAGLSKLEAVELFVRRAGSSVFDNETTLQDFTHISGIVEAVAMLPIAIELAAARAGDVSLERLVTDLQEQRASSVAAELDSTIHTALMWSWNFLGPSERLCLAQLSILRDKFTIQLAQVVRHIPSAVPSRGLLSELATLRDSYLLQKTSSGSGEVFYQIPDRVRDFARARFLSGEGLPEGLGGEEEQAETCNRLARHLSQTFPDDVYHRTLSRASPTHLAERSKALSHLLTAVEAEDEKAAIACGLSALQLLAMHGPVDLGLTTSEQLLRKEGIPPMQKSAIELMRVKLFRMNGQPDAANELLERLEKEDQDARSAHTEDTVAPRTRRRAAQLIERSILERSQGALHSSLATMLEARDLYQQAQDALGTASAYSGLVECYRRLGDVDAGMRAARRSIELYKGIDSKRLAETMHDMSIMLRDKAEYAEATGVIHQTIEMAARLEYPKLHAICLASLGTIHEELGEPQKAVEVYMKALELHVKMGNTRSEGIVRGNLGMALLAVGRGAEAIASLERALQLHQRAKNLRSEALVTGNLGVALSKLGRTVEAEAFLTRSIPLCDRAIRHAAGVFRGELALLLTRQNRHVEASAWMEPAEALLEPFPDEHAKLLVIKAHIAHVHGHTSDAQRKLEAARDIATRLNLPSGGVVWTRIQEAQQAVGVPAAPRPSEARHTTSDSWRRLRSEGRLRPAADKLEATRVALVAEGRHVEALEHTILFAETTIEIGTMETALKALTKALEALPPDVPHHIPCLLRALTTRALLRSGKIAEAEKTAQEVAAGLEGIESGIGRLKAILAVCEVHLEVSDVPTVSKLFRAYLKDVRLDPLSSDSAWLDPLLEAGIFSDQIYTHQCTIQLAELAMTIAERTGSVRWHEANELLKLAHLSQGHPVPETGPSPVPEPTEPLHLLSLQIARTQRAFLDGDNEQARQAMRSAKVLMEMMSLLPESPWNRLVHRVRQDACLSDGAQPLSAADKQRVTSQFELHLQRGVSEHSKGEFLVGIQHTLSAMRLTNHPDLVLQRLRAEANLGQFYLRIQRRDEAVSILARAVARARQTEPSIYHPSVYVGFANALGQRGRYEEALALFEEAFAIIDQIGSTAASIECRADCANIYAALGEHEKALEMLEQAIRETEERGLKTQLILLRYNHSLQLVQLKRYADAVESACQAINISEECEAYTYGAYAKLVAAIALWRTTDFKTAETYTREAITTFDEHKLAASVVAEALRATLLAEQEQTSEALALLGEEILPAEDFELGVYQRFFRGSALITLQKTEDAQQELEALTELMDHFSGRPSATHLSMSEELTRRLAAKTTGTETA